ncbi:hypothetical protein FOA43_002299 [Brettanomyces nanus]|uniref:Tubulin-specific chaperone A n=1 Tax=Eeniella nana TaxID=13502 RepID=A0A875RPE7_EENNA|nr:uncharacterized protein FOA43_002299 [Brettanomyces nanus]QPG74960.1 hypothetical protein FOA43_002299 [Brettanomyces nanus]
MGPSQIQIKASALQRLSKEKSIYEQELKENEEEVKKIEAQMTTASDKEKEDLKYTLKVAVRIRDESKRMIPNIKAKTQEVLKDLKEYLMTNGSENDDTVKKVIKEAERASK